MLIMNYTVNAANGLNGRTAPARGAKIGEVRKHGDLVSGQLVHHTDPDEDWVHGDDGLFYRAEYLTADLDDTVEFDAGGELPDGLSEVTNAGPDPEQVDPDPRHAEE